MKIIVCLLDFGDMFDPEFDENPFAIIPRHGTKEPTTTPTNKADKNTKTIKKSSSISKLFGSRSDKKSEKKGKSKSKSEPENEAALEF